MCGPGDPKNREQQSLDVIAPLFVPGAEAHGVRSLSRVGPEGAALHTTVSNLPYASVSDLKTTEAGPFVPSLTCECGRANPDRCVDGAQGTMPFIDSKASKASMASAFHNQPYMPVGPVQSYMQLRAAPLG